jgi:IS30 family transposase
MGYHHFNIDEREVILKMRAQQASLEEIGRRLNRPKGTISRELRRNVSSTGDYKPHLAQRYYEQRRVESKEPYRLERNSSLRSYVQTRLKKYWSPEQISDSIKGKISPLTIYSYIYRDQASGGSLYRFLRRSHRWRRKRRKRPDHRGQMPDRRMIDRRPKVANERRRVGDWEGDTVEGSKGSGFIVTHVDRKSRYMVAAKVADKSSQAVNRAICARMKSLPADKIKTITYDNGKEFAGFKELEHTLGMRSYFAHPYHSWERGTNENTNGLLRQFFPKGMDFRTITQADIDKVEELLNNRPRKCLTYRTPNEVFWSKPKRCASD